MPYKKMLIDASHAEEIRVAVIDERSQLAELDFETTTKRTLKGNVYLAKVTRVEPSLQAAFVEYGGSRHGFLPFNEIHPDYFRIPIDDRKKIEAEIYAVPDSDVDEEFDEMPLLNVQERISDVKLTSQLPLSPITPEVEPSKAEIQIQPDLLAPENMIKESGFSDLQSGTSP